MRSKLGEVQVAQDYIFNGGRKHSVSLCSWERVSRERN